MKKWLPSNLMWLSLTIFIGSLLSQSSYAQTHSSTGALYSYGNSGYAVQNIQSRLAYIGYFSGQPTGYFGWQTYWAVKDFQYAFGLHSDGIVGPLTMTALNKATTNWTNPPTQHSTAQAAPTTASSPMDFGGFSANDITLMSHVVYGEARNQPFEGQVAVAAVILNRYHSSKFPHSIPAIIYQPGAFTSISNGQAWRGINSTTTSAVMDAIHGWDPTHGALYYWNPATATSNWVWNQPVKLQIGNHVFAQ